MFIELTLFTSYGLNKAPTQPVWVQVEQITYFTQFTREVYRYDLGRDAKGSVKSEELTTTSISFAAGMQEEVDSIQVMETPEEILGIIRLESQ